VHNKIVFQSNNALKINLEEKQNISSFNSDMRKLYNIISKKEEISVSYLDFIKISCSGCNKSQRSIVIEKALNFIDNALNEENFALNKGNDLILKKITLDKELNELFVYPSININKNITSSIFFEDSELSNEIKEAEDNKEDFKEKNIKKSEMNNDEICKRYFEIDQTDSRNKTLLELYLMDNI